MKGVSVILGNKAEIQIAGIMIDGAPLGQPADHMNVMLSHIIGIDFFYCILVFPMIMEGSLI